MQPQTISEPHGADVVTTTIIRMRQLGVPGFPRNYELFYEATCQPTGPIARALAALGPRPKQQKLDELVSEHLSRAGVETAESAHGDIMCKLDEILGLLKRERSSMETYGHILGETSNGLANRSAMSREFLDKIVGVMATATRTSIENRNQLVTTMASKASELQEVRSKLEEYKKLADTDSLTQLHNRRAFDRELARIYDSNKGVTFGALILADIDRFKPVNDRFGHPIVDRILQIISSVITASAPQGTFIARTGGEEFAVILEGCGEDTTSALAEKMRQAVMETPFVNVQTGTNYGPITMSFGTCMATQAAGPDDLYMKADRALYASKSEGRNKVTRFSSLKDGGLAKGWMIYRKD
jgi:diguanylate cyclase